MKRRGMAAIAVAAVVLLAAGCSKQKTCRCSVLGRSNVRIIKIDKGECDQIRVYYYHNEVDTLKVDSLLCTDYAFKIDSIFND